MKSTTKRPTRRQMFLGIATGSIATLCSIQDSEAMMGSSSSIRRYKKMLKRAKKGGKKARVKRLRAMIKILKSQR